MTKKGVPINKFRVIPRRNPPKQHENLKLLEKENAKRNSKRALRVDTTRNKYLK